MIRYFFLTILGLRVSLRLDRLECKEGDFEGEERTLQLVASGFHSYKYQGVGLYTSMGSLQLGQVLLRGIQSSRHALWKL